MNKYQEALEIVDRLSQDGPGGAEYLKKHYNALQELVDKSIPKPLAENRVDYQMDWNVEVDVSLEKFVAKFTEFLELNGWCGGGENWPSKGNYMRKHQYRGKPILNEIDFDTFLYTEEFKDGWIYGNLIENNGRPFIVGDIACADDESISLEYWCPVYPETVGEFTGLPDKNGKEIYEGDIVRYREYNQFINSTVYYHGGDVGYGCYIPFGNDMESCMGSDVEVIGNIHDNPELLK